jgi:hypothetical protein
MTRETSLLGRYRASVVDEPTHIGRLASAMAAARHVKPTFSPGPSAKASDGQG